MPMYVVIRPVGTMCVVVAQWVLGLRLRWFMLCFTQQQRGEQS